MYIPPWQVPHPMVSVHNDGFMEYNKWWWYQATNALNKIQFITCIKLSHVSAQECHPQGVLEQRKIKQTRSSRYYTGNVILMFGLTFLCSKTPCEWHPSHCLYSNTGSVIPKLICWAYIPVLKLSQDGTPVPQHAGV